MNRQPDWYAQRIKDEVTFFTQQIEQERLLSEQIAQKAIAKAQADSRKHVAAGSDKKL